MERMLAEVCEVCDATGVPLEIHHIHALKDLNKKGRKEALGSEDVGYESDNTRSVPTVPLGHNPRQTKSASELGFCRAVCRESGKHGSAKRWLEKYLN